MGDEDDEDARRACWVLRVDGVIVALKVLMLVEDRKLVVVIKGRRNLMERML